MLGTLIAMRKRFRDHSRLARGQRFFWEQFGVPAVRPVAGWQGLAGQR